MKKTNKMCELFTQILKMRYNSHKRSKRLINSLTYRKGLRAYNSAGLYSFFSGSIRTYHPSLLNHRLFYFLEVLGGRETYVC